MTLLDIVQLLSASPSCCSTTKTSLPVGVPIVTHLVGHTFGCPCLMPTSCPGITHQHLTHVYAFWPADPAHSLMRIQANVLLLVINSHIAVNLKTKLLSTEPTWSTVVGLWGRRDLSLPPSSTILSHSTLKSRASTFQETHLQTSEGSLIVQTIKTH